MNAIILAGGNSLRMGFDKTFIKVEGLTLIERQIKLLYGLFEKIIVVTNNQRKSCSLYKIVDKNRLKNVKIIQDVILGQGPLGGIYSGLMASGSFYNFVVACDTPFLNLDLIKYMASLKDNFDAVVPKLKKGYEPLFAIYSKNCISKIRKILGTGNLKVLNLFKKIKLRELNEERISKFGDPVILFMNINNKEDLVKIKKAQRNL